jgi:hypothetical protein
LSDFLLPVESTNDKPPCLEAATNLPPKKTITNPSFYSRAKNKKTGPPFPGNPVFTTFSGNPAIPLAKVFAGPVAFRPPITRGLAFSRVNSAFDSLVFCESNRKRAINRPESVNYF